MKGPSAFSIRVCDLSEVGQYTDHCIEHMKERGIGDIYVHPFPSSHPWDREEFLEGLTKKWSSPKKSPGWEIAWVAVVDGHFVGHLNLKCGGIEASKHRMRLGMGIIAPYRSKGIGKALVKTAIEWAKTQQDVFWIDLSVFSKNTAAQKLYRSFGFQEQWLIQDALRVEGESIDDIQMTLKV